MKVDITVIGGGPAGVSAALRARELGATVALVERGHLGGTCTNDGCAPTRVLAKAARLMRDAQQIDAYGLHMDHLRVDFKEVLARAQQVVYELQEKKQLLDHLTHVGIHAFENVGEARFADPHTVIFDQQEPLESDKFIICAGGSARRLPFPGNEHALLHSDVWMMQRLPASVVIVGGGATGCQLASVFNAFGAQVTIMDVAPRLLITEDHHVSRAIQAQFEQHGIDMITGIGELTRIDLRNDIRQVTYNKDGQESTLEAEAVILSVGWPGNLAGLNLPAAGVAVKGPYVEVDDTLRTSVPHIFAAGDITGKMMLVQSANDQARIAAENAVLGHQHRADYRLIPHGGFTDPEYASTGVTEEKARETGDPVVAVVPYADLDRAVIDGRTAGFCKLIVDRESHLVIGAHIVGELAMEVVHLVAAGMAGGLRVDQLANLEIAYPTFTTIVGLAAREIVRELGVVPVHADWHSLHVRRGAEWERRAD